MRRWTVFVAALTILTLVFQVRFAPDASASVDKKSSKHHHHVSAGASGAGSRDAADGSGKHGKKRASGTSSKRHKTASAGKAGARAAEIQAGAAACSLPDSYKGEFGVDTKAALVLDMENGQVLFAQDADTPIAPASLTKVLTLFLINEHLRDGSLKPDTMITVSSEASHQGGSNMHLRTGETDPLEEIIKGIAVASANDGCMAVAQYLGNGDYHPFVDAMNRKAQELGMANTHFFNPNGLPADGQVTTARDMALLARAYLTQFPQMLAIHSMMEFTHNNRVRHNSNSLLGKVAGVDGLKTGFVCSSGFNIVVTAKRNGTRLVAVVLGAKNRHIREREATRLVEEGFKIVAAENAQAGKRVAMAR